MLVNMGADGVGSTPTSPLKVTPAVNDKARPSMALVVFIIILI
jgi:hypothetical protein